MDAVLVEVRNLIVSANHGQIYVWAHHPQLPAGWDDDEDGDDSYRSIITITTDGEATAVDNGGGP